LRAVYKDKGQADVWEPDDPNWKPPADWNWPPDWKERMGKGAVRTGKANKLPSAAATTTTSTTTTTTPTTGTGYTSPFTGATEPSTTGVTDSPTYAQATTPTATRADIVGAGKATTPTETTTQAASTQEAQPWQSAMAGVIPQADYSAMAYQNNEQGMQELPDWQKALLRAGRSY
jgi:hypothetical protein